MNERQHIIMNTIVKDKERQRRYEKVADQYDRTRDEIISLTGMSEQQYYEHEFEAGLMLLDAFYEEYSRKKTAKYKEQLIKDPALAYWSWFKVARKQMEFVWMNQYRIRYQVEVGPYGNDEAKMNLLQRWKWQHEKWARSKDTHRRLYHWIVTNKQFTV